MTTNFLAPTPQELEREWGLVLDDDWHTDVVGGDHAPVIRRFGLGDAAQREVVLARFGLVPSSAKSVRAPAATINARSENAATRASFKQAWVGRQWCIVPAQEFYVPHYEGDAGHSQRWRVRRKDRSPLSMAGLWDQWVDDQGRTTTSFAVLTLNCDLHPLLARFYKATNDRGEPVEKRTPVLLTEEDYDAWLDTSPGRAPIYFGTFGKDDLEAEPAPATTRQTTTMAALDSVISDP